MPATLELALSALLISLTVAVPVGIVSAARRNSWWDQASMLGAVLGQSAPTFFLGIMLLFVFGGVLNWFPIGGRGTGGPGDELRHLVLPALHAADTGAERHRGAQIVQPEIMTVDAETAGGVPGGSITIVEDDHPTARDHGSQVR